VPVDRPVQLVMTSADVIHSLYVPAFRIKMDVVPGRYSKAWFEATSPGEYDLFCAEYCGTSHSDMIAHVVVHPVGEFETWLEKASNFLETMSPVDAGRKLYQVRGCQQCHSADGSSKTGPTFLGLFGREEVMVGGRGHHLRRELHSRIDPGAQRPGRGRLRSRHAHLPGSALGSRDHGAIIEYIKSLNGSEAGE
jgi:cytochrome c oxidase subunit 2